MNADLQHLLSQLSNQSRNLMKSGKGWTAMCPAHDDNRNSLSISEGDTVPFVLKCHAGCTFDEILAALRGSGPSSPSPSSSPVRPTAPARVVETYNYFDEDGVLLSQVERMDPKGFRQRRPDGNGGWIYQLGDVRRVLYRLPELRAMTKKQKQEHAVCFVEGEKDVETLRALKFHATTNLGGSAAWRPEFAGQLKKAGIKRLIIFPDNDAPGRKLAQKVAASFHALGIRVWIVALPDLPEKGDVSDYLGEHSQEEFVKAVRAQTKDELQWSPSEPAAQEPVKVDEPAQLIEDRFTDVALARQLAESAQEKIRYCEARSCWYVYNGARWAQGSGNLVKPFVHQLARVFHDRAGAEADPDKRKRYRDQANRLETDRVIRAVINQAMALRELQIDPTRFDQHRHLLNVLNGTIDLRTGTLQPHNPDDLIARIAPVEYHPEATSELWETTVHLAMRGDEEMVDFLQRVFGYALTGYTNEKKFFDAYGPKDTGKTTICKAFEKMLGADYAHALRAEALMHQREPDKIPHEIADLMGVRFVVVSEVPDGRRFNEELMKKLSGGDVIRACFKYGNTFEFDPQLTLLLYSNDRIELGGSDDALWERATSIPFTFNFKTETTPDTSVGTTLELPEHQQGILAWAVRGAVTWHDQGLAPIPRKVEEDTEAHRDEVNAVRSFIRERCQEGVGFKVSCQTLHRAYMRWAKDEHQERLSAGKFEEQMRRLGYAPTSVLINRNAVEGYLAIQLAEGVVA